MVNELGQNCSHSHDKEYKEFQEQLMKTYGLEDLGSDVLHSIVVHCHLECKKFIQLAYNLVDKPLQFLRIRKEMTQVYDVCEPLNPKEARKLIRNQLFPLIAEIDLKQIQLKSYIHRFTESQEEKYALMSQRKD